MESFKKEVQAIAVKQVQRVFKEPLSKIKFDDLLQYMKDILDNSLMNKSLKRSNSLDNFSNYTADYENGLDFSTVAVNENDLDYSTDSVVKDSFDNSSDFRKILNSSFVMRGRI